MRPIIRAKTATEKEIKQFRRRRKKLAKRIARQTGRPVGWVNGRLVFADTGKLASGHPVPKAA